MRKLIPIALWTLDEYGNNTYLTLLTASFSRPGERQLSQLQASS